MRTGGPASNFGEGWHPKPAAVESAKVPESLSSCEGQGQVAFAVKERRGSGEIASVLARFSTLEGYASRNLETELAFTPGSGRNAQPPSWFSSEMGSGQTRSRILGFCA